jgi:hypothetical protein
MLMSVCLFVCLFSGVSKAGEIRTLPKTGLVASCCAQGSQRTDPLRACRVKAYVFHIALLLHAPRAAGGAPPGGWCEYCRVCMVWVHVAMVSQGHVLFVCLFV